MRHRFVSYASVLLFLFLMGLSGSASAEYYLVYSQSDCAADSVQPKGWVSSERYRRPHVIRHHPQSRRSTLDMKVYYVYNVFPTSACDSSCRGCARPTCYPCQQQIPAGRCKSPAPRGRFVETEQLHDFNYDMRTLDDDREY